MKYYYAEHDSVYQQIEHDGRTQWSDLFAPGRSDDFDAFPNRAFIERTLPALDLPAPGETRALEYGCGTGPCACFLAAQGFRVEAIDLIPRAIALARRFAEERRVTIDFGVRDICDLAQQPPAQRYDLIVDGFCLQSIVTDADRGDVFAAVRARLESTGYYLISTAMYDPERTYESGFRYEETTGICYEAVAGDQLSDEAVRIDGTWYEPHRRHLSPEMLRDELTRAGFHVESQEGRLGGDLICRPAATPKPSGQA